MADPIKITSILESVKKVLGLTKEYDSFDTDILMHINTVFSNLTQMGVGPEEGFTIEGYDELWEDYETSNELKTQQIRSYISLKVRSLFDPPSNGNVAAAMNKSIEEMEYRLFVEEENSRYVETVDEEVEKDTILSEEDI